MWSDWDAIRRISGIARSNVVNGGGRGERGHAGRCCRGRGKPCGPWAKTGTENHHHSRALSSARRRRRRTYLSLKVVSCIRFKPLLRSGHISRSSVFRCLLEREPCLAGVVGRIDFCSVCMCVDFGPAVLRSIDEKTRLTLLEMVGWVAMVKEDCFAFVSVCVCAEEGGITSSTWRWRWWRFWKGWRRCFFSTVPNVVRCFFLSFCFFSHLTPSREQVRN